MLFYQFIFKENLFPGPPSHPEIISKKKLSTLLIFPFWTQSVVSTEEKRTSWDTEATKGVRRLLSNLGALGDVSGAACVLRSHSISLPDWLEKNFFSLLLQRGSFLFQARILRAELDVFICRARQQSLNAACYARPLFLGLLSSATPWISMGVKHVHALSVKAASEKVFWLEQGQQKRG